MVRLKALTAKAMTVKEEFQFLYGTIISARGYFGWCAERKFQFLYGTIIRRYFFAAP